MHTTYADWILAAESSRAISAPVMTVPYRDRTAWRPVDPITVGTTQPGGHGHGTDHQQARHRRHDGRPDPRRLRRPGAVERARERHGGRDPGSDARPHAGRD